MTVMNRIEGAAINADLFQFFVSCRNNRHLSCEATKGDSVGQLITTGVPGKELEPATARLFRNVHPGGFILFGRNIESAAQLRKLIDDLRDLSDVEPIITIDQEGGRVSRLRLIGNEPPNAQQLRDKDDVDLIRRHGDITGRLLRLFGFNLDLCPVLDISFDDDADNSLRGRCYGKNVAQVVRNAGAFNEAMRGQGIASCGKHFPGYSAATSDAHFQLVQIDRTREQLDKNELSVFREFVDDVDSMMICHGWYPCFEPQKTPATLSRRIITDLLREELGFEGLIMTDDLDMGAILTGYQLEETIRLVIAAGNDLAMICHRIPEIENVRRILGALPRKQIDRALKSVACFKKSLTPPDQFSEAAFGIIDSEIWDLRVAVLGEERAATRNGRDGKLSPVERY